MKRIVLRIAVGWILGAGMLLAQENPAGVNDPDSDTLFPTATLVLKDGQEATGMVSLQGDRIVVMTGSGLPISASVEEIARLEVELPETEIKPDGSVALSGALPNPWRSRDLGRMVLRGRARWQDHQFTISAAPPADDERFKAMHFVYHPMTGDGEIVARVVSIGNQDEDSFAGIIMADGITPENRKAMLTVHFHGEQKVNFRRWGYQGGSSTGKEDTMIKPPFWLKLVREEYDVDAYYSPDGRRWRFLKKSPGKMRDEQIYVGLVSYVHRGDELSEAVIDHVSINGQGNKPAAPLLPHVVLRDGSRLAADVHLGDESALRFRGRWKDLAVTVPNVARVEFFHPLPDDLVPLVQGDRTGLLLRSGDFSEGKFQSMKDGQVAIGSVLFGTNKFSVMDQADALVLRKVVTPSAPPVCRLETQAGSILNAKRAELAGSRLVVEVDGLGELKFALAEIKSLGAAGE